MSEFSRGFVSVCVFISFLSLLLGYYFIGLFGYGVVLVVLIGGWVWRLNQVLRKDLYTSTSFGMSTSGESSNQSAITSRIGEGIRAEAKELISWGGTELSVNQRSERRKTKRSPIYRGRAGKRPGRRK